MSLFSTEQQLDRWFNHALGAPTAVQHAAWPLLRAGRNALLIAPTGQGKSLAAWRPLVERTVKDSAPRRGVRALHIAPLKALARDMAVNLAPLLEFVGQLRGRPVEMALRCGDTPQSERARQRKRPPEILSTTPESLYVLLGSAGGRRLLATVETVVVDELHALVGSKRGAHLVLSLGRLDRLTRQPVQRIGLSATARPADTLAAFLCGGAACEIVQPDPPQGVDLRVELPEMPLGPFPNTVHWQQIHARIAALAGASGARTHRLEGPGRSPAPVADPSPGSLLVFCQTRAQVERSAAALDELLAAAGLPGQVGAHHGSLDTGHREAIEARFKAGELRVLVSSASLELGLDLGHVDRVCQVGVPGAVNLVRQRAGRSGHRPGGKPCMHLFPLTLNQLVEAHALAGALCAGRIDAVDVPAAPLDVLAQHLVAMAAAGETSVAGMLEIARSAWPYRSIDRGRLDALLSMLGRPVGEMPAEQSGCLISMDAGDSCRALQGVDRLALTNAGTIPEFFEYEVVRSDTGERVGTLDEEFAFESSPGQVIQLGRRNWCIQRVAPGEVRVNPADDEAASLPFWFGEGPGRTRVMADAVLETMGRADSSGLHVQAGEMLAESRQLLGALPSPDRLVIERFFDPGGDRHIVLHTFAGARINRAWGLALRKRFCRRFNFELQAAATDDGILISLGVTSRFELAEVAGFVRSHNVGDVLTQALLDTPLFVTRFRWCANNALILLKNDRTGRVHPQRQRSQAENLVACVFPDQLACLENLSGPREVPDHPLVRQALEDCLHEYMDLDGLEILLKRIESDEIAVHAVDTGRPSPLAQALIHAPRHSYLDEAAAEERRTRSFEQPATRSRPRQSVEVPVAAPSLPAPARRRQQPAGFAARRPSPDNLERLLLESGFLTAAEGETGLGLAGPVPAGGWSRHFSTLVREKRALKISGATGGLQSLWIAAERLGWFLELAPDLEYSPWISATLVREPPGGAEGVRQWLVAGRARIDGDGAEKAVARLLGLKSVAA
ncbi:MAG: DEAD/DEAH box helicase [Pseudomonadota bacterium]